MQLMIEEYSSKLFIRPDPRHSVPSSVQGRVLKTIVNQISKDGLALLQAADPVNALEMAAVNEIGWRGANGVENLFQSEIRKFSNS